MVRANERLSVLSAEAPIHQPLVTDGTAFFQLQEEMRNAFESTVVDLPRHMLIQYPHMVHDAHVAVVVSELTLAATRDTIRILAWLKSNAPQTKVIVVANAGEDDVGALRGLGGGGGGAAAMLADPFLGLLGGAVVDGDVVAALVLQMASHGIAHHAKSQKRNRRHIRILSVLMVRGIQQMNAGGSQRFRCRVIRRSIHSTPWRSVSTMAR